MVLASGAILAGCASGPTASSSAHLDGPGADQPTELASPSSREGRSENESTPATPDPRGDLTLREALEVSLDRSPRLRAFASARQRAEALELQASRWANPQLGAEVENVAGSGRFSGTEAAETTLSFAQSFPFGGDIARRRDLAAQGTRLANWDYEAARLEVMVEVTKRFVEALAADRRLALARQELELAEATETVATERVEAGDASPVEISRVAVPVVTAQVRVQQAQRLRDAAYRRLALAWNSREATFDRVLGELDDIPPPPSGEVLTRRVHDNPQVARWTAVIEQRLAEERLARAEAIPDPTATVGLKNVNDTDDTALLLGVSLPLPLFDRRQGDIDAARHGERAARERQEETRRQVESLLALAYAELLTARDEAIALRDRALPAAERAASSTQQAFAEGKIPFLDVLDAQRTLFSLERDYLDALVAYHKATAEIEALTGTPLT